MKTVATYAAFYGLMMVVGAALTLGVLSLLDLGSTHEQQADPHYGVDPLALAEEAGCDSFAPSTDPTGIRGRGTCTEQGVDFEILVFGDAADERRYLLVNSIMDPPLYYVHVPGAVFRSEDSTRDNYDDESIYGPVSDAADELAAPLHAEAYTAKRMLDSLAGGKREAPASEALPRSVSPEA